MTVRTILVFGEEWLDVTELAKEGGCHRETVLRRIRLQSLPTWRTRRGYLVLASAWRRAVTGCPANDDATKASRVG
jgi:hypothetical protein